MKGEAIRFGTDGWRAVIGDAFTFYNVRRVAEATAAYLLKQKQRPKVFVGYDCRFMGEKFAEAVATTMVQMGVEVHLPPHFVTTPMVSFATLQGRFDLGIVITASHNPPEYSGYKIKGSYGGPATPEMVKAIESLIPDEPQTQPTSIDRWLNEGWIKIYDAESLYLNYLRQVFPIEKLRSGPYRVGYDAMYGAGQRIFPILFPGAILLHCDYNPSFKGTPPEPIEKNVKTFQALAKKEQIHFGLITDGDADRLGLVDENGTFIDSHQIILLVLYYLLRYQNKRGKVVCSFSCTTKVINLASHFGVPIEIVPVGFKHIAEIMLREKVLLGGEESGGIAVEGHIPERDGIYIGLLILQMMNELKKTISELMEEIYGVVGRFGMARLDLHLTEKGKAWVMEQCAKGQFDTLGLSGVRKVETIDGYKVYLGEEEWVMIRPSGTEPLLRLYAQSESREKALALLEEVNHHIRRYEA